MSVATALAAVFAALSALLSYWLLVWLRPTALVGDEVDYAAPSRHDHWVRVPLFRGLFALLGRIAGAGNLPAFRLLAILISAAGCGLAVAVATHAAGWPAGVVAGLILLTSVERTCLSLHLWPEGLLGLFLLGLVTAAAAPAPGWLALLAALGVATRVDFVAPVIALLALAALGAAPGWAGAGLAVAAVVVLLAGLTLRNGLRRGLWAPDTTLAFNLRVLASQQAAPDAPLRTHMQQARRGTPPSASADRSVLRSFLARLSTYLGGESFVRQTLLAANRPGYDATAASALLRRAGGLLTHGFSALVALALCLSPLMPVTALLPLAATLLAATLVQTRSRYRAALLPALAAHVGIALVQFAALPDLASLWPGGAAALAYGVFLRYAPRRDEV